MQSCSERGEREDIRGEGSICAQGEFPRWTPVWNKLPLAPVTQMGSVTPELEHELQHKSTARAAGCAECQVTAAPRRYLGCGRDPAGKHCPACVSLTAHSSASLTGQKRASANAPGRESREFNWTQFITSLISEQIISSYLPRSGGHQQDLTDLRSRKYSGWIIPTNLPQTELPAAKLYFFS